MRVRRGSQHAQTLTAGSADRNGSRKRWHFSPMSLVIGVLAVAGMLVFMYPSTAAWWSQWNQSRVIRDYSQQVRVDPVPGNAERLKQAREYNRLISTGVVTVGESNKPETDALSEAGIPDYWELLEIADGVMGRLKIPKIEVDLPIYHGTSDETLLKGVGHLEGTSLPVGGVDTHTVLTAHRGLASATLFNDLNKLDVGDTFVVEVSGEVLTYRVFETQVIDPGDTQKILPRPGLDIATLVTCTPLGINTHRILVTGERITPTPIEDTENLGAVPDIPGFPWWALIIPGGVALAGTYVWRSGYAPRPK